MVKRVSITFDRAFLTGKVLGNAKSQQDLLRSNGYLAVTQFIQHLMYQANINTGYTLNEAPKFVKQLSHQGQIHSDLFVGLPEGDAWREALERTDRITVFVRFSPVDAPPAFDCFVVEAEFYKKPEPLSHATMEAWFRRNGTVERQQLSVDTRFMDEE